MMAVAESESISAERTGDATNRMPQITGAIDWTYDVLDRVTQEVTPQGIVSYTYDPISRRLTMRANAQQPVTYTYDPNSQLSHVAQGTLSATLTHDALGRRTQLQRSNGVTTTYNYDPASRLQGITHAKGSTILEQLGQGFDPADNKTQVDQLIHSATALPPAVTAAYNALNQQTQFASATLGYDNNGNLTTDGTNTYTWDARDRLIGITGDSPPSGTGTVPLSASFSYDALDRRVAKTINGATTTYLYDGADVVTEAGASNASYLSTLNIDEPLVRQTPSGNEYYQTDDLGSTVALSDDTGAVITRYTYAPFGATTVTGTSTNPFQFTGRENDGNGLYFYRARYYSPSQSRFLSEDPLEFNAGDPNLYAYVFNSPMNFIDPTGERIKLPQPIKNCLIGMLKAAGVDLAKRKSALDPDTLMDAAQGCGGRRNTPSTSGANNAKQGNDLKRHLGYSEKYGQGGVRELPDGRFRYYGNVDSARTPGDMAGRRYVHEFDPATGNSRGWHETLDHNGNIRQVRPQLDSGNKTHYTFDGNRNNTGKR
jgi:RHS repeat-associated protein